MTKEKKRLKTEGDGRPTRQREWGVLQNPGWQQNDGSFLMMREPWGPQSQNGLTDELDASITSLTESSQRSSVLVL